jgi:hypothetical protein
VLSSGAIVKRSTFEEFGLVRVSVAGLGFSEGGATLDVWKAGCARFALAPQDTALQLVNDWPEDLAPKGVFWVASKPITIPGKKDQYILGIAQAGSRWLCARRVNTKAHFGPQEQLVFAERSTARR